MKIERALVAIGVLAGVLTAGAARVEVFPQSFEAGGWGLDAGLMDVIGSPHLIAHGMGRPVPDATARVVFPEAGVWRVFVRAKNWTEGAPGKFSLLVNGTALKHVFGAGERAWAWEDGGTVEVKTGSADIALRDLTGFDGRCAGVVFTKGDEPAPTGALDVRGREPDETRDFDFVVVGGGMPGCCAAIAAARAGIRVALVQDRPVLGGNASSEIRVWCGGESRHPIVDELRNLFMNRDQLSVETDKMRLATLQREQNLTVFLLHRAFGVEKQGNAIASVKALNLADNRIVRFRAPLFCDATGDGWVGAWAGADLRYGRESKSESGEKSAVEKADRTVLGASLMWESANANDDVPFSAPWAEKFAESGPALNGEWNWEYGLDRDMINEAEEIRDRLLLAIYGAFSLAKKKPVNSRRMLVTCPYVLGKRESRRILGDWILKEDDIVAKTQFEDAIATGTWSIDIHFTIKAAPYLTSNTHPIYGRYWIPYRTIYSRNVDNLFVVGRCFSCTHVGLGSPRVINTLSQLGVAAGTAAAMCREAKCGPRRIFADGKCRELQHRIGGDWPGNPDPSRKGWSYVDDESPDTVVNGKWAQDFCCNGGQFGDKASWSFGPETGGSVVYRLPVARAGRYRLYGKVPYDWTIKQCNRIAEIKVTSNGQAKTLSWNQSLQTGRWLAIAELELAPGATLELAPSKKKDVTITADGYALEPLN